MSEWNPSDGPSRQWEGGGGSSGSVPRRPRPRKRKLEVKKAPLKRANRKYPVKFDSTRGYPGEGPARKLDRRIGRSRIRVIPTLGKKSLELVPSRRTQSQRKLARIGLSLRGGMLAPATRRLYAEAFTRLWRWVGVRPPATVSSVVAYDRLLSEFIESSWREGATRGEAGNALSASISCYPPLRGRGMLPQSCARASCSYSATSSTFSHDSMFG